MPRLRESCTKLPPATTLGSKFTVRFLYKFWLYADELKDKSSEISEKKLSVQVWSFGFSRVGLDAHRPNPSPNQTLSCSIF